MDCELRGAYRRSYEEAEKALHIRREIIQCIFGVSFSWNGFSYLKKNLPKDGRQVAVLWIFSRPTAFSIPGWSI